MTLVSTPSPAATVLALDLARRTGWALYRPGRPFLHGVWDVGDDAGIWRWRRWARLRGKLLDLKNGPCEGHIDLIAYELSTFIAKNQGPKAVMDRGGFYAHVDYFAGHHDIAMPQIMPSPNAIKRHITGNGNASKDDVKTAVRAKGFSVHDDNEADALALLDLMLWTLHREQARENAS